MAQNHPYHSDKSFVKGATPVQVFVDSPHPVTDEDRQRPQYGRPVRRPPNGEDKTPNSGDELPPATPAN
jgi:hypothetical protein